MGNLKLKSGPKERLPLELKNGEVLYVDDEKELYIGNKENLPEKATSKSEVTTLNEALAKMEKFNVTFNDQMNFVNVLKNHTSVQSMSLYCKNKSNSEYIVMYELGSDLNVEYKTYKAPGDGYLKLSNVSFGSKADVYINSGVKNADITTGAWTTNNQTITTMEEGATLSLTFEGAGVDFNFPGSPIGGLWEFIVDGDVDNPVQISNWRANYEECLVTICRLESNGSHTIEGTFLGVDPDNEPITPPATGMCYGGNSRKTFTIYKVIKEGEAMTPFLNEGSNTIFEFDVKRSGTSYPTHKVPSTSSDITMIANENIRFVVDNVEVSMNTGDSFTDIQKIDIIQTCTVKLPEIVADLMSLNEVYSFRADGTVDIDGRLSAKSDTLITGDGAILPVNKGFCENILSASGNTYALVNDDSVQILANEEDANEGYICLSLMNPDIAYSCRINNPSNTLRTAKDGKKDAEECTYIKNGGAVYSEVRHNVFNDNTLATGKHYIYSLTLFTGSFKGLKKLFMD